MMIIRHSPLTHGVIKACWKEGTRGVASSLLSFGASKSGIAIYGTRGIFTVRARRKMMLPGVVPSQFSTRESLQFPNGKHSTSRTVQRHFRSQGSPYTFPGKYKLEPGAKAFSDSEIQSIADLYYRYAKDEDGGVDGDGTYLCFSGVRRMLHSIGEQPDDDTLTKLFEAADLNDDKKLHLHEFLMAADQILCGAPANVVLVVGGPGSGKGLLCRQLAERCGCIHLSCGDLLRQEVERRTPLGLEVEEIISRGELVSSAVITALIRRRMRKFPGRRVLLDGFPRSLENARDFSDQMGRPELALHLVCDDTILMERILKRSREEPGRSDDNIDTALQRLRTYHKSHGPTLEWLRESHVPVINLDCSGSPDSVWDQLCAIGRLMRPAVQLKEQDLQKAARHDDSALGSLLNGTRDFATTKRGILNHHSTETTTTIKSGTS